MVADSLRCLAFIGRQRELSALVEARKSLSKSSGSFVLLSGDAGIGKSRLLSEFVTTSRGGRERHLLTTECLQRAGHTLGPVRSAVRHLITEIKPEAVSKPIARALAQLAPDDVPPDLKAAHGTTTALEKDELFEALVAFFRLVCARRAVVWTIEDIHWADDSTIEFLEYLAHRLAAMRLLVVATLRSDELDGRRPTHPAIGQLQREPALRNIRLKPLTVRELDELIAETLKGHAELPPHVIRDIEARSEGNPLFAEELVKDSVERDPATRPSQLPLSIRAIVAQRADDLDADEKRILEYAAVLGQRFDPQVLALVMHRDRSDIVVALRKAFDLNLIVDDGGDRRRCRFRHALMWQTIYEGVPAFQAQTLHEEILRVLEAQPDAQRHIEELAYHAWRGGDKQKSRRYNEEAGEAAFSVRALPESIQSLERALESTDNADDRARLFERIASIERLQGRYKQSCDAFEAALDIRLDQREIDAATKLATSLIGQLYNMDNQAALPYAERFLAAHRAAIGPAALDHLLVVCARVACAFYDFSGAERYLNGVSNPDALSPSARLNFLIVQMMRHAYTGNADEWTRYADRVDDLLPHLTPENVVGIENALALTGIYLGANAKVESALEHAEKVEREWKFRGQRRYYAGVKAAYLFQRGRLADVVPLLEEVVDDAAVATGVRVAAPIAANLAAATGDDSLWERIQGDLLDEARAHLDNPDCLFLLGAFAGLAASRGDLRRAQDDLRASVGALAFAAPDAMFVLINSARYLPLDELGRVIELARVAARHAGGASSRANEALVRAIVASRNGKTKEARTAGQVASERYAALGWPLLEANALELAGKADAARTIYERCGAVADVKRLARGPAAATKDALSRREREIATMVVAGLKNEQIAKRLSVSTKTVEKHVSSIFRKLHIRSRVQLAAQFSQREVRDVVLPSEARL
jgi:DNA-binding CsgD family transcriptional regulator